MGMIVTNDNFTEVFEKWKRSVFSAAYSYVLNAEDANDLMQETFVKLLTADTEFEDENHLKAWLLRVCINLCISQLRSQKAHRTVELKEDIPCEQAKETGDLYAIVLSLPDKYRIPLHFFYYEEYKISEIAEILHLTPAAVKTRLKRGKAILRRKLKREDWLC
ncbi:MAG: sigma-70 family RNA polymerase sigma factor [Lachnospiraceae bacterium]|nr:sigma-70 family RNA polymerase sigma factor [Lachnospiraceae bacterium]